ncbi:MAG: hypothetical protein WDN67_00620 [Candidatus Moraniibacteriota bacterium]
MRNVIWNLIPGGKPDQEEYQEKLRAGLEYIERLRQDETVLSVEIEEGKEIRITLADVI